jgi:hypothetical protein
MAGDPSRAQQEADEAVLALIRAAGLEKTFTEFPADVIAAARAALQQRSGLRAEPQDPR